MGIGVLLYQFTSFGHVPAILETGGLNKGDVMQGEDGENTLTATWLTTDPNPEHCHGLSRGGLLETPTELMRQTDGKRWRETIDKRNVRITVRIKSDDRHLKHWILWAKDRIGQRIYDFELATSGGQKNAENYYYYKKMIAKEDFVKLELYRDAPCGYQEATEEQLACLRPHAVRWIGKIPLAPRDD